jgi:adenosylmethionine-8-amino-7-oxononanoate aminotransferase
LLSNRAGESFIGKREQATQRRVAQIDQEINEAKKKITALESEKAVLQSACMHVFVANYYFKRCCICEKIEVLYY